MSEGTKPVHGLWSNRFTYMLASVGAAVGLGNIWKFPYIVGENGGGAFVLVYLLCILFIGIPIMMAEVSLGRRGRKSPGNAVKTIAEDEGHHSAWSLTGWLGVIAGYLVLSFYCVIAGWTAAYIFEAGSGQFVDASPEKVQGVFTSLLADPLKLILWTGLILTVTATIVARGVQHGLEKVARYLTPGLLLLLIVMAVYAANLGDFSAAFSFMFNPDFSSLTMGGVLIALGHSFFTLGLASGVVMMYGAYLPDNVSITKTTVWIAIADTVVALLAGMAIYPIVFGFGLEPGEGPGLIFMTLPIAFGQMWGGTFFGTLFFIMLAFAAFTSAISMIESSVAWLVEKTGFTRWQASMASAGLLWALSMLSIFSFSGAEWTKVDFPLLGKEMTSLFDIIDHMTSDVLLPLGGLVTAVFTGWIFTEKGAKSTLNSSETVFKLWRLTLRWIAPVAILIVFLRLIGVINL